MPTAAKPSLPDARIFAAMLAACLAGPVSAQTAPEPASPQADAGVDSVLTFESPWTVRFEPAVAYFGLSGDLTLPAETSPSPGLEVTLEDLNLDSPRLSPFGELHFSRGKWRITLTGFGVSIDRSTGATFAGRLGDAPVAVGDLVNTDVSYTTFAILGSYRVWSRSLSVDAAGDPAVGVAIDLIGGARFHDVDYDLRITPALAPAPGTPTTAGAEAFFAEPVVGARLDLDFSRDFGIDFYATGGGFGAADHTSYSFDLGVGFVYRPVDWLGTQVGYRLLAFSLSDGDGPDEFQWDGAVAGLYWGLQLSY